MGADVRRRAFKIVASIRVVRHRREVGLPTVAALRRVLVFKSEKRADSHSFTKNQIDIEFAAVALCGGGFFLLCRGCGRFLVLFSLTCEAVS